ncbi:CoA-binding protein [Iodidimonas gelatinilytica]|uniref:CoA-binding protein n=1 Tax=Iodidimonas gelatinilytica TaxID=1236966 RepID=A0A5A7MPK8_9PROT|nr:CoA-binding protein [Iodidimonas gelatinilytica]GEQ97776.1 CoA-binding protein [Iodidimonas gelatinilytica]GER01274.1 CoA-binding protein [Iodidimonas gelatinilytica]
MFKNPSDDHIHALLERVKTIAVVGASLKDGRPSRGVARFLMDQGYRIIPVNPAYEGQDFAPGVPVLDSLDAIDQPVDMVDIFRRSADAGSVVDEAIRIGAKAVWLQEGVWDEAAAQRAEKAGLMVVMDRCPAKEIPRLGVKAKG